MHGLAAEATVPKTAMIDATYLKARPAIEIPAVALAATVIFWL